MAPTVAVKDRYTLEDFTAYAQERFSVAFESIADPDQYAFDLNLISTDGGEVEEALSLHIAFWNGRHLSIPVWAFLEGNHIRYAYGKSGCTIRSTQAPYPSEGRSMIKGLKEPFLFVSERPWPRSQQLYKNSRVLTRKRLALLVRFVFLLAGHIHAIENEAGEDLLLKFKDLCMHMQQQKRAIGGKKIKREEQFQMWAEEDKVRRKSNVHDRSNGQIKMEAPDAEEAEYPTTPFENMLQPVNLEQEVSDRRSARAPTYMGYESAETGTQHAQKRRRTMAATKNRIPDLIPPALPEQSSAQVQRTLQSLTRQCRAEVEQEQVNQNEILQAETAELRAKLAEQKEKTETAEAELKEHEADWQTRWEQQEIKRVDLEVEVKQWREKYEKLNRKVQIFLKDD